MEDTNASYFGDFGRALLPLGQPDAWRAMIDTTVLAAFLEYSPNPTWLADSDGRCIYANQELREITALSAAQLGDLNWLGLVAEEDRQMSSTLWQGARIHHQPFCPAFFRRARG